MILKLDWVREGYELFRARDLNLRIYGKVMKSEEICLHFEGH